MRDDDDKPEGTTRSATADLRSTRASSPVRAAIRGGRKRKSKELRSAYPSRARQDDHGHRKAADRSASPSAKRSSRSWSIAAIKGDPKPLQLVLTHLEKHREVEPFTPTEADDAALLAALSAPDKQGGRPWRPLKQIAALYRSHFPAFVRFAFHELHPGQRLVEAQHIDVLADHLSSRRAGRDHAPHHQYAAA